MAADASATAHLQTDQEDGIPEDQCRNCGRVGTLSEVSSWPCHRTTGEVVCPACSAYARAHGGAARPPRLWHRERQQLLEAAAEPGADVHKCCHCGLLPKAGERHRHFHRRTQERLCSACEIYAWRHAGRMRPAALLEAYRGGWAAPGAARCPQESRRVPSEQWEMPGRWAAWRMAAEPAATGQRSGQGALQQGQLLVTQQAAAAEVGGARPAGRQRAAQHSFTGCSTAVGAWQRPLHGPRWDPRLDMQRARAARVLQRRRQQGARLQRQDPTEPAPQQQQQQKQQAADYGQPAPCQPPREQAPQLQRACCAAQLALPQQPGAAQVQKPRPRAPQQEQQQCQQPAQAALQRQQSDAEQEVQQLESMQVDGEQSAMQAGAAAEAPPPCESSPGGSHQLCEDLSLLDACKALRGAGGQHKAHARQRQDEQQQRAQQRRVQPQPVEVGSGEAECPEQLDASTEPGHQLPQLSSGRLAAEPMGRQFDRPQQQQQAEECVRGEPFQAQEEDAPLPVSSQQQCEALDVSSSGAGSGGLQPHTRKARGCRKRGRGSRRRGRPAKASSGGSWQRHVQLVFPDFGTEADVGTEADFGTEAYACAGFDSWQHDEGVEEEHHLLDHPAAASHGQPDFAGSQWGGFEGWQQSEDDAWAAPSLATAPRRRVRSRRRPSGQDPFASERLFVSGLPASAADGPLHHVLARVLSNGRHSVMEVDIWPCQRQPDKAVALVHFASADDAADALRAHGASMEFMGCSLSLRQSDGREFKKQLQCRHMEPGYGWHGC